MESIIPRRSSRTRKEVFCSAQNKQVPTCYWAVLPSQKLSSSLLLQGAVQVSQNLSVTLQPPDQMMRPQQRAKWQESNKEKEPKNSTSLEREGMKCKRLNIPQKQMTDELGRVPLCALKFWGWNTPAKCLRKENNKVSQLTVVTAKPKVSQKWLELCMSSSVP